MKSSRATIVSAVCAVAAMVMGCATMDPGPTPAEEVLAALNTYHEAEKAENVDGMLAAFSEDFPEKYTLPGLFEGLAASGILQTFVADMTKCEIAVEGDSATAGPVTHTTSTSAATYMFTLKKEADGVWRFANVQQIYQVLTNAKGNDLTIRWRKGPRLHQAGSGSEMLFHQSAVLTAMGLPSLSIAPNVEVGKRVTYEIGRNGEGPVATDIMISVFAPANLLSKRMLKLDNLLRTIKAVRQQAIALSALVIA